MRRAAKRVTFGVVATVLFFLVLETASRAYSAVRYHNVLTLTYGKPFVRRVLQGTLRIQDEYPFVTIREQEDTSDWMFQHRNTDDPDVWLPERDPVDVPGAGVVYHLNQYGLRSPDFRMTRPHDVTRIATLGGSFVLGWDLDERDAWPRRLEARLNTPEHRYDVINAGVNGANIHKVLALLVRLAHDVKLDYVVVASAYNDHATLHIERRLPLAARVDFALYNLSWFYVMSREKLGQMAHQPVEYSLYRQQVHVSGRDVDAWRDTYRRRLAQIAQVCREHDIRLVLAAEPEMFFDQSINVWTLPDERVLDAIDAKIRAGNDVWRMELEYYLQGTLDLEMRRFATNAGLWFFDGASVFPADKRPFFIDQIHLNPAGSDRLANMLAQMLRHKGIDTLANTNTPVATAAPRTAEGSEPEAAPYVSAIRDGNTALIGLRHAIEARDRRAITKTAAALRRWFDDFASSSGATDVVTLSRVGSAAAADLETAANAGDQEGVVVQKRVVIGACRSCHDAHRTRLPDGESRVK